MTNYDCVGVLGGGSWGTTLAHILGENNQQVLLWLRNKESLSEINEEHRNRKYTKEYPISKNVTAVEDLREVAERCEIIIVAIPSGSFREVAYQLGNHLQPEQILLSACKGLENETHARMTTILQEETCCRKTGVLAGPNLYEEIMKGHPSATVVASRFHEVISKTLKILTSEKFRVYGNDDIIGAELGGAIKNVIAIAAGAIEGLDYGDNTKALLVTRGITEMSRIGTRLGADPLTFTGLTGMGDTIVTCSSKLSRNYRVGYHLAKGESLQHILDNIVSVAEGINTARVLHQFADRTGIEVPIIQGVYQVLYENRNLIEVTSELMKRKAHWEIDPSFRS